MKKYVNKAVLVLAVIAGLLGSKGLQLRLEGIAAGQDHLFDKLASGGSPSRGGGGIGIKGRDKA